MKASKPCVSRFQELSKPVLVVSVGKSELVITVFAPKRSPSKAFIPLKRWVLLLAWTFLVSKEEMSIFLKALAPSNIASIRVRAGVSKEDKSSSVKASASQNISSIFVTALVSKPLKSRLLRLCVWANIRNISVTELVSKLDKSNSWTAVFRNIPSILRTCSVSKASKPLISCKERACPNISRMLVTALVSKDERSRLSKATALLNIIDILVTPVVSK